MGLIHRSFLLRFCRSPLRVLSHRHQSALFGMIPLPDSKRIQWDNRDGGNNAKITWNLKDLGRCVSALKADEIIAIPTDTIYGIAGLAQSNLAVSRIYDIKQRDAAKPIAICVSSVIEISLWADAHVVPEGLLDQLLPGPVTLVFKRKKALNPKLNPDMDLIGVRIPDNHCIVDLVAACGEPLALTSANLSGGLSPLHIKDFEEIWSRLDVIVDSGNLLKAGEDAEAARLGSTVVDLSQSGKYRIVRPGSGVIKVTGSTTASCFRETIRMLHVPDRALCPLSLVNNLAEVCLDSLA